MGLEHSPNIVTSGLVAYWDALNPKSYPGSGTTWTDPINNIAMGTVNNPTYNSGSFAFATNQYAYASNSTALDTQTPTVEVWIKTNAVSQNGFWFEKGTVNTQYSLFQEGGWIQWRQYFSNLGTYTNLGTASASYLTTSSWFQVVGTFTSGSRVLYVNGAFANSDTQAGTINTNANGQTIGSYNNGGTNGYFYNGNIAIVKVYNKALSAAEVLMNYNALKGRFGL